MKKLIVVAMTMAVAVAANASQCCWGSVSGEWYNVNVGLYPFFERRISRNP